MTVLATAGDRLVEQLARRIRGPLRAAGPEGLPLATIKALAGFGWTAGQIALALEHLGAVAVDDAFTVAPVADLADLAVEFDVDTLVDALRAPTCGCPRPLAFRVDDRAPRCLRCGKDLPR